MIVVDYKKSRAYFRPLRLHLRDGHLYATSECRQLVDYNELIDDTISVAADGPEMDYIFRKIHGIPFASDRESQKWHGDIAKFIINNLDFGWDD